MNKHRALIRSGICEFTQTEDPMKKCGWGEKFGIQCTSLVQGVNLISLVSTYTRFIYVSSFNYVVSFYGLGKTRISLGEPVIKCTRE